MARRLNKKMSEVENSDGNRPNRRERRQILKKEFKDAGYSNPKDAFRRGGPAAASLIRDTNNAKSLLEIAKEKAQKAKENPSDETVSSAENVLSDANKAYDKAVADRDAVENYTSSSNREKRQARREYKKNIQFPEGVTSESLKSDNQNKREERRAAREEGRNARFNERQERRDLRNDVTEEDKPKIGEKITSAINSVKNAFTGGTVAGAESNNQAPVTVPPKQAIEEQGLAQDVTNSLPVSGAAITNSVAQDPNATFEDQNKAVEDAKVANNEEDNTKTQVVDQAVQTIDAVDQSKSSPVVTQGSPISTEGVTEQEVLPGSGQTVANVQGPAIGGLPSYQSTATKQDVANYIAKNAALDVDNVPGLVLDKLQAPDYYPNISKDINVGTYSGKYLGSVSLFAAPGARLPMGLYDARKRALVEQAKAKQAEIEKLLTIPKTDPLYQAQFSESFLDGALGYMQKHKFNMTSLKRDPEALQFFARYQAKATEITAATTFADSIISKSQDLNNYVPKAMRDNAYDVKMNLLNRTPDILAGNESAIKPIQDAKVFSSLVPSVDKLAKDLLDPNRMSQSPLRLKNVDEARADAEKRGEKFNAETYEKEKQDFLANVNDMNTNTDTYVTGIVKFFGGDYSTMIDQLIASTPNATEEQAEALKQYFAAQIQKQEILKYTTSQNANVAMANLAERRRQFDLTRRDQENNFWGGIDDANSNAINKNTGKSYNQELQELQSKNLSGPALQREMQRLAETYQVGSQSYYDPVSKSFVNFVQASPEKRKQSAELQPTYQGGKAINKLSIEFYDKNKKQWVQTTVPVDRVSEYKKYNIPVRDPGSKRNYDDSDYNAFASAPEGKIWTKPIGYEVQQTFINERTGQIENLKADGTNLKDYNESKVKQRYVVPINSVFTRKQVPNPATKQMEYIDVETKGITRGQAYDISTPEGQAIMNNQSGYTVPKAAASSNMGETYDYTGTGSGFSATTNPGGVVVSGGGE